MDRNFIERESFPTARKGLDPEAVRAHLRSIADAVEEAARTSPATSTSAQAGDQVRGIIEAAENSADEIVTRAQREADELVAKARTQAQGIRDQASAAAAKHLEDVEAAGKRLQERADATEADFESMLENLRAAGDGLLERVRGGAGEIQGRVEALLGQLPSIVADWDESDEAAAPDDPGENEDRGPAEAADGDGDEDAEAASAEPSAGTAPEPDGEEGARIVALNMALSGSSREETERYLAENFNVANPASLLDDVFMRVS